MYKSELFIQFGNAKKQNRVKAPRPTSLPVEIGDINKNCYNKSNRPTNHSLTQIIQPFRVSLSCSSLRPSKDAGCALWLSSASQTCRSTPSRTRRPSPTSAPTAPSRLPTPATCPSTSASTPGPSPTPAPTARKHSGSSVTYSSTHGTGTGPGWAGWVWMAGGVFKCACVGAGVRRVMALWLFASFLCL